MRRRGGVIAVVLFAVACSEAREPAKLTAPDAQLNVAGNSEKRWVIVFNQPSDLPANVERIVADAGGRVLTAVPQIGALVAVSSDEGFATKIAAEPRVRAVSENVLTQGLPRLPYLSVMAADAADTQGPAEPPGDDTQTGSEPFYNPFQWDKKRMRASNQGSYGVQRGRRDVVVAILDTGADVLPVPHIDIAPNLDAGRSRSFTDLAFGFEGDPNPASWDDKHGHGSWCASAVAAPINGRGMSGVAPQVTVVALKVLGDDGRGDPFALVLALVYAGMNRFDVASMSLGLYTAHAGGQAYITAVQRALEFARMNGVTPIAALGNEALDVSDGSVFGPFVVLPAELPGVIGVSATGMLNQKAYYSNFGVGKTDVSAPGGDTRFPSPMPVPPFGAVLGAWATEECGFPNCYVFAAGTSMATPNAAGVAALIISQYGDFTPDNSRKLHMSPTQVESILQQTANNQACPEPNTVTYPNIPQEPPNPPITITATCKGEAGGYTNFFGKGIVDAFKAVTSKSPTPGGQ